MNALFNRFSDFVHKDPVHVIDLLHTRTTFWLVGMKSGRIDEISMVMQIRYLGSGYHHTYSHTFS